MFRTCLFLTALVIINSPVLFGEDLARYKPLWIRDGYAEAGTTHEPWIFQVRLNGSSFNQWQREQFDYRLSEEFIQSLAESGVTVYHLFCYKGFGFEAEKESMDQAAKAAAIAHKYGMKVQTYVQWNTMCYETFFKESPEAQRDLWYQVDVNGKPVMLYYGYQQSFRFRPCFNHDAYMNYLKEKILRYVVEKVNTDFVFFDNFNYDDPREADHNPAAIAAFRKYLEDKYTPAQRLERFGFEDVSYVLPPMWNDMNPPDKIVYIADPVMQEWTDFRCWTMTTRLAECSRFVRSLKKEVAIAVNAGNLDNRKIWEWGINHGDLMQYTDAFWAEARTIPHWENGRIVGRFRNFKAGRTTDTVLHSFLSTPQCFAECLALNRTIGFLGEARKSQQLQTQYLDFWHANRAIYSNAAGAEKIAVLRSYPSMAYNLQNYHSDQAEQFLQQRQMPFDIIFDQQLDLLGKYDVLVLANQECLTDETIERVKQFVRNGGGLVATANTGLYDGWRRLRKSRGFADVFGLKDVEYIWDWAGVVVKESGVTPIGYSTDFIPKTSNESDRFAEYGKGRAVYLAQADNMDALKAAVNLAAGKRLPLIVNSPEWVGVSHDSQVGRDIVHLFNYRNNQPALGITLECDQRITKAWAVSPDRDERLELAVEYDLGISVVRIPRLEVYEVIILEK